MRRFAIAGLFGLSLMFAALPFAGTVVLGHGQSGGNETVTVPVRIEQRVTPEQASAAGASHGGCPFAAEHDTTQF